MLIRPGEEYRGPGQADPSKTRDERKAELRALSATSKGQDVINYYFAKYTGLLDRGIVPPVGADKIETILEHEYP